MLTFYKQLFKGFMLTLQASEAKHTAGAKMEQGKQQFS